MKTWKTSGFNILDNSQTFDYLKKKKKKKGKINISFIHFVNYFYLKSIIFHKYKVTSCLKIEGEKTTGKNIGESHLLYKMIKENKAFIIWFCQTVFHQYTS